MDKEQIEEALDKSEMQKVYDEGFQAGYEQALQDYNIALEGEIDETT